MKSRSLSNTHYLAHSASLVALAMFSLPVVGCGSGDGVVRAPVSGKVTLGATPLAEGVIRFVPTGKTKGPSAVATIQDGVYQLSEDIGPVVGKHRVEIEAINHYGFELDDEEAFIANVEKKDKSRKAMKNPIDRKYNRNSTLEAEISADGNSDLNFVVGVANLGSPARVSGN